MNGGTEDARWPATAVAVAAVLGAWQLLGALGRLPDYILPPSEVAGAVVASVRDGTLGHATPASLRRLGLGFLAGGLPAVALGLAAGMRTGVRHVVDPVASLMAPLPKIALFPAVAVWLGFTDRAVVLVIALACFHPSFVNAMSGALSIDPAVLRVARNVGAGRWRTFWQVALPASLPRVLIGLRISLAVSFVMVFATEAVSSRPGLGFVLVQSYQFLRYDRMYAALAVLAVSGFLADRLLVLAVRRVAGNAEAPLGALTGGRGAAMESRPGRRLAGALAVGATLAAWEVGARVAGSPLFPRLTLVLSRLWRDASSGLVWDHARVTLSDGLAGLGIALVTGVALGLVMARVRLLDAALGPLVAATYPVPKLALYPLVLLTFGLGTASKVAIVGLECMYPIAYATYGGARSVDVQLLWVCRNAGAGRLATIRNVIVPATAPSLLAGVRVAVPTMLVVMVVTELLGESRGLGFLIRLAGANFEPEGALAVVLLLGILGFLLDRVLLALGAVLLPWDRTSRR